MFIGHAAVGFASKAAAPRVSLGVLLAAPFLLDLLWPVFVLTGIESARIEPGQHGVHADRLRQLSLVPQPPDGHSLGRALRLSRPCRPAQRRCRGRRRPRRREPLDLRRRRPPAGPSADARWDGLRRHGPLELEGRDPRRRAAALRARRLDLRAHDPPEGRGRPLGPRRARRVPAGRLCGRGLRAPAAEHHHRRLERNRRADPDSVGRLDRPAPGVADEAPSG